MSRRESTPEAGASTEESEPPAPSRRRWWLSTVGLVVVFVLGWSTVAAVLVVRGRLLDEATYSSALVRTDAFERTYTEVFADPEMAELKNQLLGDLGLSPGLSVQARALATSALRWTVPPSTLQRGTDLLIATVLAYIRGDVDGIDADVTVAAVLAAIDDTAVTQVRTLLAGAADRTAATVDEFAEAVIQLADQLAAGTVPGAVPVIGGTTFDTAAAVDAIMDLLGPRATEALRRQVTAAVIAGDERDAVIHVLAALVAERANAAASELRSNAEDFREFDVVAAIAEHARQPADEIVSSLDVARSAATWFRPITAVIGALLAGLAAAGLLWLNRRSARRATLVLAVAFLIAGAFQIVMWWVVARLVEGPLDKATSDGPSSWNLPPGLRSLLADVREAIADDLADTVVRFAAVLLVAGVILAGASYLLSGARAIRPAAVGLAAVASVGIVIAGAFVGTAPTEAATRACNGHVELCDRAYDDVVFAATHNAMSSPDVVQVWPEHDGDLRAQLDAGVRALLIDSHTWPPVESAASLAESVAAAGVGEPPLPRAVVDALYPTFGSLRDGREGTFLCHNHCIFGGIPFVDAMESVRGFLDENPDEVVTLIIQDAISPEATEEVMRAAGLEGVLYSHDPDGTWPTLGEMIDRGERLVVFAEKEGPPPDWYANAFEAMQETPFLFLSASQFSSAPNRGDDAASLFLMNHWVQRIAPDRVDATVVNQHDVLVDRARQCADERGLMPNYIAVNFYNIGDLMSAVDTLNEVD